ncbi:MAG: hypothetical protein RIS92_2518 [Verrucomicrobiota bacterium]
MALHQKQRHHRGLPSKDEAHSKARLRLQKISKLPPLSHRFLRVNHSATPQESTAQIRPQPATQPSPNFGVDPFVVDEVNRRPLRERWGWGDRRDSNPQQPESQSGALPLSYGHQREGRRVPSRAREGNENRVALWLQCISNFSGGRRTFLTHKRVSVPALRFTECRKILFPKMFCNNLENPLTLRLPQPNQHLRPLADF